jgi:hypothetical protein
MKNPKGAKFQIPKDSGAPVARGTLLNRCGLAFGIFRSVPIFFGIWSFGFWDFTQ